MFGKAGGVGGAVGASRAGGAGKASGTSPKPRGVGPEDTKPGVGFLDLL